MYQPTYSQSSLPIYLLTNLQSINQRRPCIVLQIDVQVMLGCILCLDRINKLLGNKLKERTHVRVCLKPLYFSIC